MIVAQRRHERKKTMQLISFFNSTCQKCNDLNKTSVTRNSIHQKKTYLASQTRTHITITITY